MFRRKGTREDGSTEQRDAPGLPEYPAQYDVRSLPNRAALRTTRFFAVVATVSLLINLLLGGALVGLTPLKTTEPYMVQFEQKSDVVSTIRPMRADVDGFPLLVESLVRKYVVRRESIPRTTETQQALLENRWGSGSFLSLASTSGVYDRFAQQVVELLPQIRRNGVRRDVTIRSVTPLQPLKLYQVEFVAQLYGPDESLRQETTLQATMEIGFRQRQNITRTQALNNPTGFTVLSYNLVKKAE